jgi:hypothetical protein
MSPQHRAPCAEFALRCRSGHRQVRSAKDSRRPQRLAAVGIEPPTFSLRGGTTPSHRLSTTSFGNTASRNVREIPHKYQSFRATGNATAVGVSKRVTAVGAAAMCRASAHQSWGITSARTQQTSRRSLRSRWAGALRLLRPRQPSRSPSSATSRSPRTRCPAASPNGPGQRRITDLHPPHRWDTVPPQIACSATETNSPTGWT